MLQGCQLLLLWAELLHHVCFGAAVWCSSMSGHRLGAGRAQLLCIVWVFLIALKNHAVLRYRAAVLGFEA